MLMKHKIFKFLKLFVAVCLIIPCCFGLSACKNNTPYIGDNGNWFIGSTDTGIKAAGQDGKDGKDAEPVDTYEIWQNAVRYENYQGTYLEFIKEYFTVTTDITSAVANACTMSVVEVIAYNNTSDKSTGSGVIYQIDEDGSALVLTNYHVVVGSGIVPKSKYGLRVYGQEEDTYISAEFVGGSSTYDVAILKVTESAILKTANATAVTLNTASPTLGETCIAIGNPKTYGIAVNKGVISRDSEYVYMTVAAEHLPRRLIRHDAFISGGSSGGGLFDINGHLIGLTCGGTDGTDMHYAIPASIVEAVVESTLRNVDNGGIKPTTADLGMTVNGTSQSYFNPSTGKVEIVDTITITDLSTGLIFSNGVLAVGDQLVSVTINPSTQSEKTILLTRDFQLKELLLTIPAFTNLKFDAIRTTVDGDQTTTQNISTTVTVTLDHIVVVK